MTGRSHCDRPVFSINRADLALGKTLHGAPVRILPLLINILYHSLTNLLVNG